jgi:hypothetical protein
LKSKIVDVAEVQRALDRAARNALRGSSDVRAGKVLIGRDKAGGQFAAARDKAPVRSRRGKK